MKIARVFFISATMIGFASILLAGAKATPPDIVFLDQFSEHHTEAIKMAEMAVSKASDPQVKQMAEKMASDQKKEIAQMKKWRKEIDASAPRGMLEMPKMDMSGLREKSGREFDVTFLDMMSRHHSQGVEMAKAAVDKVSNLQVKAFAQAAADNQDRERKHLEQMRNSQGSQNGTVRD